MCLKFVKTWLGGAETWYLRVREPNYEPRANKDILKALKYHPERSCHIFASCYETVAFLYFFVSQTWLEVRVLYGLAERASRGNTGITKATRVSLPVDLSKFLIR